MEVNIFRNLTTEQFAQVRTLTIEMVLATDMSKHFAQLKHMKRLLSSSDGLVNLADNSFYVVIIILLTTHKHTLTHMYVIDGVSYKTVRSLAF